MNFCVCGIPFFFFFKEDYYCSSSRPNAMCHIVLVAFLLSAVSDDQDGALVRACASYHWVMHIDVGSRDNRSGAGGAGGAGGHNRQRKIARIMGDDEEEGGGRGD